MTAIAFAMLASVLLATAVLGFVGLAHELTRSPRGRRWVRRRRVAVRARTDAARGLAQHRMRVARRALADQLRQPAPVQVPQRATGIPQPAMRAPERLASP